MSNDLKQENYYIHGVVFLLIEITKSKLKRDGQRTMKINISVVNSTEKESVAHCFYLNNYVNNTNRCFVKAT